MNINLFKLNLGYIQYEYWDVANHIKEEYENTNI